MGYKMSLMALIEFEGHIQDIFGSPLFLPRGLQGENPIKMGPRIEFAFRDEPELVEKSNHEGLPPPRRCFGFGQGSS